MALTKDEYLAELRARRRALNGDRPGEARAIMLAIGYLGTSYVAHARWALESLLEAEAERKGEFFAASRRELERIIGELEAVIE